MTVTKTDSKKQLHAVTGLTVSPKILPGSTVIWYPNSSTSYHGSSVRKKQNKTKTTNDNKNDKPTTKQPTTASPNDDDRQ